LELDDLSLVRKCQAGDDQAFRTLVLRYQRKVFTVAFALVKDREEAMDIAQDAFLRVHQRLGDFKGESSFYTWLYRITRNLAIDRLRARRGDAQELDEKAGWELERADPGFLSSRLGTNPQRGVLRKELAEQMARALGELPEKHREILVLREVEGMSYEELAETLGIPKGTVMSRLYHARAKMQAILRGYLGDEPLGLVVGEEG